jgi:SAM-dependent methyltransferase
VVPIAVAKRFLFNRVRSSADQQEQPRTPGVKRTVEDIYEQRWGGPAGEAPLLSPSDAAFVWGDQCFMMQSVAIKRIYLLYLYRVIAMLAPSSALEIGCGNGINLALLASRFPNIAFTGVELTAAGVRQCRRLCGGPLPAELSEFSPEPLVNDEGHRLVRCHQGDAARLPYAPGAFDLVFTILALEQMEKIKSAALSEISRVCRGHAVMIEPFGDWNMEGLRQRYVH